MWQSRHTAWASVRRLPIRRNRAGGRVLISQVFGRGAIPPNIGSKGGASRPLRGRHSGKGRAVPGRRPSIRIGSLRSTHFAGGSITREMIGGETQRVVRLKPIRGRAGWVEHSERNRRSALPRGALWPPAYQPALRRAPDFLAAARGEASLASLPAIGSSISR